MNLDLLIALAAFAFVSSITPGPNNLMLMASGANFGFRRSVPHMLGISIGFCLMVFLVGVGLAQIFKTYPAIKQVMTVCAVGYMSWLAYKIATAAPINNKESAGVPLNFFQAAAFQWVNPKAWAMALTAVTTYSTGNNTASMALIALVFALVNLPSVSIWTVLGQQLRRYLNNPGRLRIFNYTMAILLLASMVSVLLIYVNCH